jgi:hypothetical protein
MNQTTAARLGLESILDVFGPARMVRCGNCGGERRLDAEGRCLNCKKLRNSRYYHESNGKQMKQERERRRWKRGCEHGMPRQRDETDAGQCRACKNAHYRRWAARLAARGLKRARTEGGRREIRGVDA